MANPSPLAFLKGQQEQLNAQAKEPYDPVGELTRNLESMYKTVNGIPSNVNRFVQDPVAYAKSLPTPTPEQLMGMLSPSHIGGIGMAGVIKPKDGRWLTGEVEKGLQGLKQRNIIKNVNYFHGPEFEKAREARIEELKQRGDQESLRVAKHLEDNRETDIPKGALNQWIDKNLTNYVKKEMGTPEDPVRKLAEQGILHTPMEEGRYRVPENIKQRRFNAGFPIEGMGQSDLAKAWEHMSDASIYPQKVKQLIDPRWQKEDNAVANVYQAERNKSDNPWLSKLNPEDTVYENGENFNRLGFDHILDVLKEDLASGRLRPESIKNISMEQAVRRTYDYDQALAKKMEDARAKKVEDMTVHKEYPNGMKWVQLDKPGQFASESEAMGHSVRGYEPPQGHPDWTPESGDSGNLGYGHGGWEGIKSGKAKIYSLVDPKGNPHATVETKTKGVLTDNDFGANDARIVEGRGDFGERGYRTTDNQFFEGYSDAVDHEKIIQKPTPQELQEPSSITQIKGKGNRAPNENYLPYVQDFVKSGNWSDVGDLHNTGLLEQHSLDRQIAKDQFGLNLPKFTTPQESKDYMGLDIDRHYEGAENLKIPESLLKYKIQPEATPEVPPTPPIEGMKRGGKVHISNNPDIQWAETTFKNKKFANGGIIHKAKGGEVMPHHQREANKSKFLESSKVKDRVYHGTGADITEFKPSIIGAMGPGTYVTTKPKTASDYSNVISHRRDQNNPNVLPLNIQVKNPFPIKNVNRSASEFFLHFDPTGKLSDEEVIELAKKAGYDAVHALEDGEINVFDPRKIKSAIGNRGTYDINDPDITKAKGGIVSILRKHGRPVDSDLDAMRKMSNGHRVFIAHEQDEKPREITSVSEMHGYTPDQIYTVDPQHFAQHKAKGGSVPSKYPSIEEMLMKLRESGRTPILPAPNRWFADPEKHPHQQRIIEKALEQTGQGREGFPSGLYINPQTGEPMDFDIMEDLGVAIDPVTGRPMMSGKKSNLTEIDPKLGSITKSNLVRKGLFKHEGGDQLLKDLAFLATIEKSGKGHHYGLSTHYASPAELVNTMTGKNPTLRPHSRGDIYGVGDEVGRISIQGKHHPVYEKLLVAPTGMDVQGKKLHKAKGGVTHAHHLEIEERPL